MRDAQHKSLKDLYSTSTVTKTQVRIIEPLVENPFSEKNFRSAPMGTGSLAAVIKECQNTGSAGCPRFESFVDYHLTSRTFILITTPKTYLTSTYTIVLLSSKWIVNTSKGCLRETLKLKA